MAITPLHPSASLGGYEWRYYELLLELEEAEPVRKPYIQIALDLVAANFQRMNPGQVLVPCPSPYGQQPTQTPIYKYLPKRTNSYG